MANTVEHEVNSPTENDSFNHVRQKRTSNFKYWDSPEHPFIEDSSVIENEASPVSLKVSRVSQLDADLLDKELGDILYSKLFQGFTYFKTDVKSMLEPELCAIIQLILFRLSVLGPTNSSYGSQLQNLKFRDDFQAGHTFTSKAYKPRNTQLYLYGAFMVGGQYLSARWQRWAIGGGWGNDTLQDTWKGKAYHLVTRLEKYAKLASLIHFLVFLYNGRYRGIIERLLGLRLVNGSSNGPRQLNYEFLNRQLIWDGLTEFLLFVAPLINYERMSKYVRQVGTRLSGGTVSDDIYSPEDRKFLSELPPSTCALCYYHRHLSQDSTTNYPYFVDANSNEEPTQDLRLLGSSDCRAQIPHVSDCGHVFCYQCLQTTLLTATGPGSSAVCPRCSLPMTTSKRYLTKVNSN